jgi:gamma-glutamylcyclotransferase (GGCT)/AIG2-like uncharacterized protein YtfP
MTEFSLFVYGTLKPGEFYHSAYCGDRVLRVDRVYTWGKIYHLSLGYPGMGEGEGKVHGVLLTFADATCLEAIDQLEGYRPDRPSKENEYQRCQIPVFDERDRLLTQTWGYRMHIDKIRQYQGIEIPSGWWTNPPVF